MRSGPTAVPDQQTRCNGCILPASTAPLDNVMCPYTALNCTNKLLPLCSLEIAQKCVTHSAERGHPPFTIRVVASRYNWHPYCVIKSHTTIVKDVWGEIWWKGKLFNAHCANAGCTVQHTAKPAHRIYKPTHQFTLMMCWTQNAFLSPTYST